MMTRGTRHVLIVEDDRSVAMGMRDVIMGEWPNVRVTITSSLERARTVLCQDPPNLVTMDGSLPDGLGLDLVKELRELGELAPIVIACPGDPRVAEEMVRDGAAAKAVKPQDPDTLIEMVGALLFPAEEAA